MNVSKIDINDYSAQEIFDMLKLRKPTKEMFLKKVMDLLNKAKDKVTKQFLLDAKGLVLTSYFNIQDIDDYSQGEDEDEILLQNIYNSQQIESKKKQKEERIIHIDSKYRSGVKLFGKLFSKPNGKNEFLLNPSDPASPTSYLLSFENPLLNVVSMRLNSLQIPVSWHTFDHCYGNTYFWIESKDKKMTSSPLFCVIYPWTYTSGENMVGELQFRIGKLLLDYATTHIIIDPQTEEPAVGTLLHLIIKHSKITFQDFVIAADYYQKQGNKELFNIYRGDIFPPPTSGAQYFIKNIIDGMEKIIKFEFHENVMKVTVAKDWLITFHSTDKMQYLNPPPPDSNSNNVPYNRSYVNHNLGWFLGFRNITKDGDLFIDGGSSHEGNTVSAIVSPNLNGTKTLFITIDDHTRNYSNTSFTNILQLKTKNSLPGYYSRSSDMITDDETSNIGYLQRQVPKNKDAAQKNLTLNQVYAANEILSSIRTASIEDHMLPTPVLSNELAVIPLKNMSELRMPNMIIEQAETITEVAKQNYMNQILQIKTLDASGVKAIEGIVEKSLPKLTNKLEYAFSPSVLLNMNSTEIINNVRIYNKPVTLERIGVKIYDENGYLLNLNGYDWNFTLKFEQEIYS